MKIQAKQAPTILFNYAKDAREAVASQIPKDKNAHLETRSTSPAMRTVMVGNQKGGVGKTMITKSLAEYAGIIAGLRVLLIDLDPQSNLTRRFLDTELQYDGSRIPPLLPDAGQSYQDAELGVEFTMPLRSDASEIFKTGVVYPYATAYENIEIIPGHERDLDALERIRSHDVYEKIIRRLHEFLYREEVIEAYDICFVDTRPSRGPLTQAALYAATHMLVPTQLTAPAVEGLQSALYARTEINRIRERGAGLELIGILPNMVRRGVRIHEAYLEWIKAQPVFSELVIDIMIPDWMSYNKSMVFGEKSIFLDDTKEAERPRAVLETLGEHVLKRLELERKAPS